MKWLTITEASKYVGRDTSTLRRNIENGNMFQDGEVRKISYLWQIKKSALDREYKEGK